jgi:peptidylprolyl isomerase
MIKAVKIILPSLLLLGCSQTPPPQPRQVPDFTPDVSVGSGTHTTVSGLQYEVLRRGTGTVSPRSIDTVKVHYHGTLLNGTVFDSSVERGEPISFPLNQVIRGWTEGVHLMKVGDKFRFVIPSHLAYGDSSPTPKIPPRSTLVFEIELLAVNGSTN